MKYRIQRVAYVSVSVEVEASSFEEALDKSGQYGIQSVCNYCTRRQAEAYCFDDLSSSECADEGIIEDTDGKSFEFDGDKLKPIGDIQS